MKTIVKTAIFLGVLMLASSCVLDSIDSQPAVDPRLQCDVLDTYTVQAVKPQDIAFSVSSTTPWRITGFESASWISVTPSSSDESSLAEDIIIKAKENETVNDRSVVLTLTGDNTDAKYSFTVKQMRRGKLTVTPIEDSFPAAGGSNTFKVESNIAWEAEAGDDWLSLSPASGTSDGDMKSFSVKATATENSSIVRSTVVTVTAGDEKFTFNVTQNGQTLEFEPLDEPVIDRLGGELVLNVNASMDWKLECDNEDFTVTKEGNDKVKVSAPFNNKFAPRTAKVTIKPVSSSFGDVSSSVEISQDINFTFSGHCEVLEDGSVKIYGDDKSRVKVIDGYRYVNIIIKMGEKNFKEKSEMWLYANDAVEGTEIEIQNQIQLGKRVRVRLNGHLPNSGLSCYDSVDYDLSQSDLNNMEEYRVDVVPGENYTQSVRHLNFSFSYNGSLRSAVLDKPSVFADEPTAACHYWFGCYNAPGDGSWYIVKSCDVIPVEE